MVNNSDRTETGQLMTSFRPPEDKAWDYVRPSEKLKPFLRFEHRGEDLFELICLDGWPSKVATNRPDGSYATKDLFKKHSTLEAYKYFARLDDTIILVNGEKAIPLGMEGAIRQHPFITEAVVFGTGKPILGLLLIPSEASKDKTKQDIVNAIWPAIEKAHSVVPAYARISKDMITILSIGTKYPQTDKGTVIRQAFYRQFEREIEEAYEEDTNAATLTLAEPELRDFLLHEVVATLKCDDETELGDDVDFFGLGMDSLQATQLRSSIVRQIDTGNQKLGLNVVFDYPTISQLAKYLHTLQSGPPTETASVEETMQNLITKYSQFSQHVPIINETEGRFIVSPNILTLTAATYTNCSCLRESLVPWGHTSPPN